MTATDILTRLKAATGPDRELDCLIFCATAQSPFISYYPDCVLASLGGFAARVEIDDIDRFTSSIDAALALVERMLPGCIGDLHWGAERSTACILRQDGSRPYFSGATPALAILTALFGALASKESTNADE